MRRVLKRTLCIFLLLTVCVIKQAFSQAPVNRGAASPEEIKKAKAARDSDLNNLKTHRAYIYAMGIDNPAIVQEYELLMKSNPKNVNIPLAIGTLYYQAEMPQAKEFLIKVAEMEPKNAAVWSMLSSDAESWGNHDLSDQYIRKAALADTSNADYAYAALSSFEGRDPNYSQKVFAFVKRFPASERGAQALYWLGVHTTNLNDKIYYFEELRKLYPPQKFKWSGYGMVGLSDAYLQTDPEKALSLINEMGEEKDITIRKPVAELLIRINKLEHDQNYREAVIELDKINLPRFNYIDDFIAFKKASLEEKAGDAKSAYDSLSMRFAKLPTDQLSLKLEFLGQKMGKDKGQIEKDIHAIRNNTATPAYPFELGLYNSNGKLKLTDLKGKVVLLTFWFPGCSPCRAEFPYLQNVVNKFNNKDVVYAGVNVFPEQDPYVIPLMKNTKFSFIPLRGTKEFAAKYYGVQGEPENFLIDKDGNIVFRSFRIDNSNERTLELMISSLLK